MKIKQKIVDIKESILNDGQSDIIRFFITLIVVVIVVLGLFYFTKYAINDGDVNIVVFDSVDGAVNYNIASIGTMLGKEDEEYYVFISSSEDDNLVGYQVEIAKYTEQDSDDILPIFYVDLASAVNNTYIATDENPENLDATSIDEMYFGDATLIKVKNGKVVSYITDIDDMAAEFGV